MLRLQCVGQFVGDHHPDGRCQLAAAERDAVGSGRIEAQGARGRHGRLARQRVVAGGQAEHVEQVAAVLGGGTGIGVARILRGSRQLVVGIGEEVDEDRMLELQPALVFHERARGW